MKNTPTLALTLLLFAALSMMSIACGEKESAKTKPQDQETSVEDKRPSRPGPSSLETFEGVEVDGVIKTRAGDFAGLFYQAEQEIRKTQPKFWREPLPEQSTSMFESLASGDADLIVQEGPIGAKDFALVKAKGASLIEVPIFVNAVGFALSKENTWCQGLSIEQVRQLFAEDGAATWKDLNDAWPAEKVVPITFSSRDDVFKEFEAGLFGKEAKKFKGKMMVSSYRSKRIGTISRTKGAIGTVNADAVIYNKSKVRTIPVEFEKGESVAFTKENIRSGKHRFLRRTTFLYLNAKSYERAEVQLFVHHLLKNLESYAQGEGFVMPRDEILSSLVENLKNKKAGTHFVNVDGSPRMGQLEEHYKAEKLTPFR